MKIDYLNYVIPVVSIFLTYILGTLSNKNSQEKEVSLKRYEGIYVPYMQKLLAGLTWKLDPSDMSFEARSIYFDILMNNTQYLGKKSASLVPDYYKCFLDLLEYENGNDAYESAMTRYDVLFFEITIALLEEAEALSKSLKYPNLPRTILSFYEV